MNLQEFGQTIKQKYPQYKDMDDTELANKVLVKYPVYKSQVTFEPPKKTFLQKAGEFIKSGIQSDLGSVARFKTATNPYLQPLKQFIPEKIQTPVGEIAPKYQPIDLKSPTLVEDIKKLGGQLVGDIAAYGMAGVGEKPAQIGLNFATKKLEQNLAKKTFNEVVDLTSPVLTKKEKIGAIVKGTVQEGKGILGKSKVVDGRDLERAKITEPFIDTKKSIIENVGQIKNAITTKANNIIGYLKKTEVPYGVDELASDLQGIEKPITLKADKKLNSVFSLAQNKFLEFAKKESKDMAGLLEARKKFDSWIEGQIPKIWEDGSYKPVNDALRKMRLRVNDYIVSNSYHFPDNISNPIRQSLREQNLMYEAIDNMAEKEAKNIGKSQIVKSAQIFAKKHPVVTKAGEIIGTGIAGAGLIGIGKSMVE